MQEGATRLVDLLARTVETCLIILLAAYFGLITAQIVLRFFRLDILYWSEELVRYLLVWSVLLGATVATHRNAHVRVDIAENVLSGAPKKALEIASTLVLLAFAVALTWAGVLFVQRSGTMTAAMLGVRMSLVYSVVALSGILDIVFLLARLFHQLHGPDDYREANAESPDDVVIDTTL